MAKLNCWEILNCPEDRRMQCSAYVKGLGRRCWRLEGTYCGGRLNASVDEKLSECLQCSAYQAINSIAWYQTTYFRFAALVVAPVLTVFLAFAVLSRSVLLGAGQQIYYLTVLGTMAIIGALTIAPAYQMCKPVNILREKLREIGKGNLAADEAVMPRRDEFMLLAVAVNDLKEVLRATIRAMDGSAEVLKGSASQLVAGAEETAAGAGHVAETMSQMAANVEHVTEAVKDVTAAAVTAEQHAAEGSRSVVELKDRMQSIQTVTQSATSAVDNLRQKSIEIGQITDLITQIADQTNLLALNAAIEAARAGDQGRGFAVVADEVRKLAEQSGNAADRIRQLIASIQATTAKATEAMSSSREEVKSGVSVVGMVNEAFGEIISRVKELTVRLQSASAASQEITDGMGRIAATAQEQSASTEEVSAAANTLAKLADDIKLKVRRYHIE
ncbi:MAG: methyl-accepting chemotaxis protein [Bacillota bacterium]|uniref:methyl-accepting chemotaxis protein n=1 Tax=Desulforudis sp. DRI-14 TaxID=3459793 RepID=UPI00346CC21B